MNNLKTSPFLFPGQGSQIPGMGKFLVDNFNTAKLIFEEASEALLIDLKKLCFESDEKTLALTENTQPALLTVSVATAQVLQKDLGFTPSFTAGHSIGEYSSFVLGGSLTLADAVRSVRQRGLAMQAAVPVGQGGMTAALGLTQVQAEFLCEWTMKETGYQPISPANYNCEGQIVLSGNIKALNWLKDNFKTEILILNHLGDAGRVKFIPLQVSAPFHCQMMKPAEDQMRKHFEKIIFNDSKISILQNFSATVETKKNTLKENLICQISAPVLWTQSMHQLKKLNSNVTAISVVECGQGSVLKGLLKKIDAEFFQVHSTGSLEDIRLLEKNLTVL